MRKIITIAALLLAVIFTRADAQERQVTGKITSSDGGTLPGVTVIVKGTTIGTNSDLDGVYKLTVPADAKTLKFVMVGMKTKEVDLGTSTTIDVLMETDVMKLDEVVVTAVGMSSEKKRLGYSVQEVGGDELTQASQSNALTGLAGKVAGLQVIQSSGSPGSSVMLRLRGATSITGDNSPLIVIDGIPMDNSENVSGNPDNGSANNLIANVNNSNRGIDINPDDIETITALKGPSATALYGINAANGAIVITTKKGGKKIGGGINVSYKSSMTWDVVNKTPDMQNQYVKGSGGKLPNSPGKVNNYETGSSGSWGPSGDTLAWDPNITSLFNQNGELVSKNAKPAGPKSLIPFTPFDNVKQFFRTGETWENSLALSGGTDVSSYRFSFSSLNQTGIVPNSDFNRYTTMISGKTNLSDKFYVSGSVSYSKSGGTRIQQGSNLSGLMLDLLRTPVSFDNSNGNTDPKNPTAYILPDGTQRNYRGGGGYDNPYWTINQCPFVDDVNRMFGNAEIGYNAYDWLKFTYRIGTDFYTDHRHQFFAIDSKAFPLGQIFEQEYFYRHVNSDFLVTATKKFNSDLDGSITLGQNMFGMYNQSTYTQGDNLSFPDFQNLSVAANILSRESHSRYRKAAIYGKGELSYKSMLYLEITGRNEMTSTLDPSNNTFFYPSTSLGFVFTEPLKMSTNKWLPYGKLRFSYAGVGKDAPVSVLQNYYAQSAFADGWTPGVAFPQPVIVGSSVSNIVGFTNSDYLGNTGLKPEHTSSTEIGTDLRFLKNRIGLDFTYYYSKSTDQILPVPIAGSTGYQFQFQNTGSLENKGIEIQLTINPVKLKDFDWNISFNWSQNKSKVLSLGDTSIKALYLGGFQGSAIYAVVGQPYGTIYGGRWLRDGSGNMVIEDRASSANYGYPIQDNQVGAIGDINPKWIAGINNSFTFKKMLTLTFNFDIRHGGQIWNGTKGALTYFGRTPETANNRNVKNYVFAGVPGHYNDNGELVSTGGSNGVQVATDQAWYQGLGGGFNGPAEQFVEDGSYVKLRELALTYSIPKKCLRKLPFAGIDISFIGRNLWLSTKYSGVDPETSLSGSGNSQGMDYFNMPNTKSYGFSLKVTL